MDGRPRREDEPEEEYYSKRLAALNNLNGTGKHRSITPPTRPPGIPRVEQLPQTTRVARPKHETPRRLGRGLLILIGVLLACTVLACVLGYFVGPKLFTGINASSGAATTANDFLQSIVKHDYENAYKDLGGAITTPLTLETFEQQAQHDDACYGSVKSYTEVSSSTGVQGNTQSYTYSITREKVSSYEMQLTLQQDMEASDVWRVTSYGGNLGPSGPCR